MFIKMIPMFLLPPPHTHTHASMATVAAANNGAWIFQNSGRKHIHHSSRVCVSDGCLIT